MYAATAYDRKSPQTLGPSSGEHYRLNLDTPLDRLTSLEPRITDRGLLPVPVIAPPGRPILSLALLLPLWKRDAVHPNVLKLPFEGLDLPHGREAPPFPVRVQQQAPSFRGLPTHSLTAGKSLVVGRSYHSRSPIGSRSKDYDVVAAKKNVDGIARQRVRRSGHEVAGFRLVVGSSGGEVSEIGEDVYLITEETFINLTGPGPLLEHQRYLSVDWKLGRRRQILQLVYEETRHERF